MPTARIQTEVLIDAEPDHVWSVFTDYQQQPSWNSFLHIDHPPGPMTQGEVIRAKFTLPNSKPQIFTPKVLAYEQNKQLRWRGKLWNSDLFFVGEHYFELKPQPGGKTLLVHGEDFSGVLIPLIGGMMKKTEQAFLDFNSGLKRRVEEGK